MSRIAGVVLAAGGSKRMGVPKQLLALEGASLVRRAARVVLASRCDDVFVVVGAHAAEVTKEIDDLAVRVLENRRWHEGLASSIRTAVTAAGALPQPAVDAILLTLVDQPAVGPELLDQLIAALENAPAGLVAAEYAGTIGAPALFARRHFPALLALSGDRGGKSILAAHGAAVVTIPFPEGVFDIDTPADLERVCKR